MLSIFWIKTIHSTLLFLWHTVYGVDMANSIPESFILCCALYKDIERKVMLKEGYINNDVLIQAVSMQLKNEKNAILTDLYTQILDYLQPEQ